MSSLLLSLPELFNAYKSWLCKNPQIAGDYESTVKLISYFIAGRIHNSHILSELIYSLSNLLVLFNDEVIRNGLNLNVNNVKEKIKLWLAVVEYSEVLWELSGQKRWGNKGKWLIIMIIQIFKCLMRFILIHKYKEPIIDNPPVAPLDRGNVLKYTTSTCNNLLNGKSVNVDQASASTSFTLKRSGRVIRRIDNSPPLAFRTWKPVETENGFIVNSINGNGSDIISNKRRLLAEYLYICKPLTHLASIGLFGIKSWKPWILSFTMDIISLELYMSNRQILHHSLTKQQRLQLSKRTIQLILYLIRSPFYEQYSRHKIDAFLIALSRNLPLVRIVCQPLLQYLPFWQSTYFYMWST